MADTLLHIPPEWTAAAEHVHRLGVHRIVVLGARDTGKSTFCRILLCLDENYAERTAPHGTSG